MRIMCYRDKDFNLIKEEMTEIWLKRTNITTGEVTEFNNRHLLGMGGEKDEVFKV